jgi:hypothetical protein
MEPARVVHLIDKARQPFDYVAEGPIVAEVDLFTLERFHEALRFGVVIGIAATPHRSERRFCVVIATLYFEMLRRPLEFIQYTSIAFGQRCGEAGVRPSMDSVGDCFDNAMCESFFATLESELLDRRHFQSQIEARMAVFEFIEGWDNPHRRHSAINYLSPIDYERTYRQETLYPSPTPSTESG